MPECSNNATTRLVPDNTNLTVAGETINEVELNMNNDLINIGAFCLRMRENCSVRLQMADLLGGCEFCHGFYEKYELNFCSISLNSC